MMEKVAILIFLVLILIQDVKYRGVHWALFLGLFTTIIWGSFQSIEIITIGKNVLFLLLLLCALTIYLSLRFRKLIRITDGFFSSGDILFLLIMIPLFTYQEYVVFFTIGTLCSLLIHVLISQLDKQKTVPYAGYMALVGIIVIGFKDTFSSLISGAL